MPPDTDVVDLSSPLALACGQILPNRVMKSALSEGLATSDHAPDSRLETLYRQWGAAGYGLVVTGNVMVDRSQLGEPGNVSSRTTATAMPFSVGESDVRRRRTHLDATQSPRSTGQSDCHSHQARRTVRHRARHPRDAGAARVERARDSKTSSAGSPPQRPWPRRPVSTVYRSTARTATWSSQFLSPLSNKRDDGWGGDLDGECDSARDRPSPSGQRYRPASRWDIKLNSADFQRGGFSEEESRDHRRALVRESIDLIEISGGSYESPAMMGTASTQDREAYFLEYARTVREAAGAVPLAVTGGFRTRSVMSRPSDPENATWWDSDAHGARLPASPALWSTARSIASSRRGWLCDSPRRRVHSSRSTELWTYSGTPTNCSYRCRPAAELEPPGMANGGDDGAPNRLGAFRNRRGSAGNAPTRPSATKFRPER